MPYSEIYHYHFINNVFGSFVRSIGDFFRTELFPRTTEIVVSTYSKAVQHYKNRISEVDEMHHPGYPFMNLDLGLDFEPEERAGKFFYNYPAFENKFALDEYKPVIYEDANVKIAPVLNRYKGRFDLVMWCGSFYEAIDYRVLTYQFFGGLDRPIYPKNVEGYFILPEEIIFYTYANSFTGDSYVLDWDNTSVGTTLVKNINQDRYVFPFSIRPYIKLTGVSDGSEKYGGDDLSEARISIEMEWECSIPTHLIIRANHLPALSKRTKFDIGTGFHYVMATAETTGQMTHDDISMSIIDTNTEKTRMVDIRFKSAYNYILTEEDQTKIENNENITIIIPETIPEVDFLKVWGKFGEMKYQYNWNFISPNIVEILGFNVTNLEKDDVITFTVYEEV